MYVGTWAFEFKMLTEESRQRIIRRMKIHFFSLFLSFCVHVCCSTYTLYSFILILLFVQSSRFDDGFASTKKVHTCSALLCFNSQLFLFKFRWIAWCVFYCLCGCSLADRHFLCSLCMFSCLFHAWRLFLLFLWNLVFQFVDVPFM